MKKILHISKYYYPFRGGTEQIAQDCVNSFADSHEQRVICFHHEKKDGRDQVDGVDIIRCGCFAKISSQPLSLSYGRILRDTLKDFQPDIVIFHYPNPFVAHYLLKYLSAAPKLIVYWHLDIIKQTLLRRLFVRQNHKLVKRADLLIATSPGYAQWSPYLNSAKEKCKVVPNCINVERLAFSDKAQEIANKIRDKYKEKIICLAVGRHTEYKGFKYLVQASKLLDDRFEIFIIGSGEETEHLIQEAGNDQKIHFLGAVDDDELKAYLSTMDIFCFPSITNNEAFGLALAEGMYYGKPAVTFHIPGSGVNYVCRNGKDGIEVPNRDVSAYAKAMTALANNPRLRKELGENGKQHVMDNFLNTQFKYNIQKAVDGI